MCGIIGLFLKDEKLNSKLGSMLSSMLNTMSDRGPDSSGLAIYNNGNNNKIKLTLKSENPQEDFKELNKELLQKQKLKVSLRNHFNHIVLTVNKKDCNKVETFLKKSFSTLSLMSSGENIEIFKEVGLPKNVIQKFGISKMIGTHGIGHTRMATESAVTTLGAHPFSTGPDQCLVHNGSLSNHNQLRQKLINEGMQITTENDTEVAASYLSLKIKNGKTLKQSLELALSDLDGFYTFLVGTKDGFGVLRDPISCKPAVMAENDYYVAFGSEYRAFAYLPDINHAKIWEPEPATVYFWNH
ncbi:MAG: glutamine amidotransferase family protein [Paracoccaceae bacterium]